MRKLLFIACLIISVISCTENKTSETVIKSVNIKDLTPSPVVHESLTEEQLDKITFIYKTFKEVYPISLDETIVNFKRDQNPDREINVWLNMAETYQLYVKDNSEQEGLEKRKEAFKLILMRSMMSDKEAISKTDIKQLTQEEAQNILSNYTLEAKPLVVK